MSFNNLILNPLLIRELYKKTLVDFAPLSTDVATAENPVHYLGNNEKNICIIVNEPHATFIKDEDLQFLINVLSACKLSLADVAVVNNHLNPVSYSHITNQFNPEIILLFGIPHESIGLPLHFPDFQLQRYDNKQFLAAPPLTMIALNPDIKKLLWANLQKLFIN